MRHAACLLRNAVVWRKVEGSCVRNFASREELLERLRRAKAEEIRHNQPITNMWEDRRAYVLLAGLLAASGWAYSLLTGTAITDYVYMDLTIGGMPAGRLVLGLHGNNVPRTSLNFLDLATHKYGYGYRGNHFFQVVPRFSIVGGDITKGDGTGGVAALGPSIVKEKSNIKHMRGTLSMVTDKDSLVRSQFFICCIGSPALNNQMVAFGKVVEGIELVDVISQLPTDGVGRPLQPVVIAACGKLSPEHVAADDGVFQLYKSLRKSLPFQ